MPKSLGHSLRELRINTGLSQSALAERAGVSAGFINKLEAGEYSTLSIDKSHSLAKGLGLTFRDFLEAVGWLDNNKTPNVDEALASALRKRRLTDEKIGKVISFVNFVEKER